MMIAVVVALLLFGGVLAADQALQNPDLTPEDADTAADQEQFVESTAPLVTMGAPVALFALLVGLLLAGVRAVGGA